MNTILETVALAVLLVGSSAITHAQQAVYANSLGLRLRSTSQTAVYYGDSKSAVIRMLGAPTKTSRFFFEIDNAWATVLHYGPNQLYFLHNRLEIAEVHDSRWLIGKPGATSFRVGSPLRTSKLTAGTPARPAFGHFVVENKPGVSRNLSYSAISYGGFKLPHGGEGDEEGYAILFDKQGRVAHVFIGSY